MEYLDIIDVSGNIIGQAEKGQAHAQGLWHRAFHCWILSQGKLVFQLRSKDKNNYPDKFDISAAGHIAAGESVVGGACARSKKKLGLQLLKINLFMREFNYKSLIVTRKTACKKTENMPILIF